MRAQGFEVNREKYADIMVYLSPPELFFPDLLHQNESFDMMRTREFEVNKKRGKSDPDGKERKCDKRILHISCQLPLIFSIFLLILVDKIYEEMSVKATDLTYPKSSPEFPFLCRSNQCYFWVWKKSSLVGLVEQLIKLESS